MNKVECKELGLEELKELKRIELIMLKNIHDICEKNGIAYSLAGGTLLGAVRHGGFIPWDDDIDIMMPRKDYEKFLLIGRRQLGDSYEIVSYKNYDDYGMPFAKVIKRNTKMIEPNTRHIKAPCGVFVDVFPIDIADADDIKRKKSFDFIKKLKAKLLCRSGYVWDKGMLFDTLYKARGMYLRLIPKSNFINDIEKEIYKAEQLDDVCLISYCGISSFERSTYSKKWFENYIDISFEQYSFKAICGYKELLKLEYGDYMRLPPVEERIPHHRVVEFKID